MPVQLKAPKGADADALKRELSDLPGVAVTSAAGGVTVDVPDTVSGELVSGRVKRQAGLALVQRVRQGTPATAALRDAIADAIELMLGL